MSLEKLALPHLQPEQEIDRAAFMAQSLADMAHAMQHYPLPATHNYPGFDQRLYIPTATNNAINLPPGSWDVGQPLPTELERQELEVQGESLDIYGRPVHPWLAVMIANPALASLTGKGNFYHWGANRTADPIIIQNDHVLLILRDNGQWALSGGFVDPGESALTAAIREAGEEAAIDPLLLMSPQLVYEGPVADLRMTAHAWIETSAFLFRLPDSPTLPNISAQSDALDANWVPIEIARQMPLYGSHNALIELALRLPQ